MSMCSCTVCVNIFSNGGKFRPVSYFTELHACGYRVEKPPRQTFTSQRAYTQDHRGWGEKNDYVCTCAN